MSRGTIKWLPLLLLAGMTLLPWQSSAQGGQGAFGGSAGGRAAEAGEGDAASFQHILTPGDRGEWPLTVREGETILALVSATTFDPAAELVDAAGKVLASNDDIRPGVQDALILYRFPAAGKYSLLVKGFKSAAGGQYTLTLRRFLPTDLRKGERAVGELGKTHTHWHRFSANVGETLVVTARSAMFDSYIEIIAPNGERVTVEPRSVEGRAVRAVFRAETKGDYYLRVGSNQNVQGGYAVTVATARVVPTAVGATTPLRRIEAGGLDLWTFAGTAGDLVRAKVQSGGAGMFVGIRYLPPADPTGEQDGQDGAEGGLTYLPSDAKAKGEIVALLKHAGNYHVEVSQPLGMEKEYTLTLERKARAWAGGAEPAGTLPLGGSDYWALDGKAGQIVRMEGVADPFDIELELYNARGEKIESNDDGDGGRNALLTALLKETGHYLVRVHAFGNGGSGPYRLRRRPDPVRPLKIGARMEAGLGAGSSDVWSFQGKAGQTVLLSVRSNEFATHVSIFGPDALEIANSDRAREGTDSLLSVRLPLAGAYTIWVSSLAGDGKYVLRLMDGD